MNESEKIKRLKAELEETRDELIKANIKIMHLDCFLKSTSNRFQEIIKEEGL